MGDRRRELGRRRTGADHRGPRTRLPDPRGPPDDGGHPHRGRDGVAAPLEGHRRGRPRGLRRRRVHHHPAPRPRPAAGIPVHSRPRLHRRRPRLRPGQRRRGERLRHLSAGCRRHRGPARRRQPGDDPGVELAEQPAARPRLLRAGARHRWRSSAGWNPGCKPPRCTITACSVRCGSYAKREAGSGSSEPGRLATDLVEHMDDPSVMTDLPSARPVNAGKRD